MFEHKKNNRGFSLAELVIVAGILGLISLAVSTFGRDIFFLNSVLSSGMNAQLEAKQVMRAMVSEIREAAPSNLGSYPIASSTPSSIIFYSDTDNDGNKDRIRYFLDNGKLKKGRIIPSGSPSVYNEGNETISTLISDVVSSSTLPLFQYFPSSYTGSSGPLSYPINISSIRLVKITVIIERDPNRSPIPMTVTSQVSIRNLKDNL